MYINIEYNGLYSEDMSSWIEKGLARLDTVKACPKAIMDIPGDIPPQKIRVRPAAAQV